MKNLPSVSILNKEFLKKSSYNYFSCKDTYSGIITTTGHARVGLEYKL